MIKYCIIGNGKVAKHFCHYFNMLKLPFVNWHKGHIDDLSATIKDCSHVLVLISDDSIDNFITENSFILNDKILVHFSASIATDNAYSLHPLQTFSEQLEELEFYQQIPFAIFDDSISFSALLPDVPNDHFHVPKEERQYYHALCVMANNFTTILWQKFFHEMTQKFNINEEKCKPILQQTFKNLLNNQHNALTGPLQRGDRQTINKNIQSLKDDPFQKVYQAFVNIYKEMNYDK